MKIKELETPILSDCIVLSKKRIKIVFYVTMTTILGFISTLSFNDVISIILWTIMMISFLCFFWFSYCLFALQQEMRIRLAKVPSMLVYKSIEFYGKDEWQAAAIECYEAHLPGDCPLCGAE
jgi:hypothetical protein